MNRSATVQARGPSRADRSCDRTATCARDRRRIRRFRMPELQTGRACGQVAAGKIRRTRPLHLPALPARRSASSRGARSRSCRVAGGQEKFWPMHDLLFANQDHLKAQNLHSYAERLDLDLRALPRRWTMRSMCSASGPCRRSRERSRNTPTFFVNGVIHDVSYGLHAVVRRRGVGAATGNESCRSMPANLESRRRRCSRS